MSTNAAELKGKLISFKSELETSNAGVFIVQETHYLTKGKVIEKFDILEAIRNKVKGETMNLVHTALKPFLIQEYSNELRHLVVERTIANKQIRIISGYGPQENWAEAERMPFFHSIRTGNYKS